MIDTAPFVDLGLEVKRQMFSALRDSHMGERGLGRQPAFNQPMRCRGLAYAGIATAAGIPRRTGTIT